IMMMKRNFILNKHDEYICQIPNQLKRKKKLLGELYDFPEGSMAIGRLDEDPEGLLFLTTDGMISEKIRSRKTEKEYWVQVDGVINEDAVIKLRSGVEIGFKGKKYNTRPAEATIIP